MYPIKIVQFNFTAWLHACSICLELYTAPLLKGNSCSKNLNVADFCGQCGVSNSPVISKIFEHCVLRRFSNYFVSSDNRFGFKRAVGCSHAIYTVRSAVDHYVSDGSTVNLCAF